MKKYLIGLLCIVLLLFCRGINVYASSGSYSGTCNNLSFHMNYSATTSKVTCAITCLEAHNVEAIASIMFDENGTYFTTVRSYTDPGTSAATVWYAGTGRYCIRATVTGCVNDIKAYQTIIAP